jgi:hypothetical protein
MMPLRTAALCALTLCTLTPTRGRAAERVDLDIIHRIRQEALSRSKVMEHLFMLADVYGPRLTGSPAFRAAGDWAVSQLQTFGLKNAHRELWGPFGRGWSCSYFSAHLIAPQYAPLIGVPLAWSAGAPSSIDGEPLFAPLGGGGSRDPRGQAEWDSYVGTWKGRLRGRIVLISKPRELELPTRAPTSRFADTDLQAELSTTDTRSINPVSLPAISPHPAPLALIGNAAAIRKLVGDEVASAVRRARFFREEGVAAIVVTGSSNIEAGWGDGGTVLAFAMGSPDPAVPVGPPALALTPEHYNRLVRLLEHKIPTRVHLDIHTQMHEDPQNVFNVIAEIPGTDKKDEIVMLGAHLDSTTAGTGATDDAAGSAMAIEAVRVLQAVGARPRRTIRVALWGGEEEGLRGSSAYVRAHFADPEAFKPSREHARLDVYFNLDNGSGRIRGIYTQDNDAVRPIFEEWLAPLHDLGATTVSSRLSAGSDHLSFDEVGLPGFAFMQDPLDYFSRTVHTNMDVLDRASPTDLMQGSAVLASFAYLAAMRDQLLPRKLLPSPHQATQPPAAPPAGPKTPAAAR